jgi:RNA polymerase II subunit A small phosphatase-like protein
MTKLVCNLKLMTCVASRDHTYTDLDPDDVTRRKADAVNARSVAVADSSINGGEQSEVKEREWEQEREKPVPPTIYVSPSSNQTNSADVNIILPSTPTKALLPISETEGMNSGAVQLRVPPEWSRLHQGLMWMRCTTSEGTVLRAEDTPHTTAGSFTGLDESHGESEVEQVGPVGDDDEDTLILNGGAGIPIGPVSFV